MSTTVTIRSRCHEDWVPEWPHSHRIDEFGNLAIMSRCHRPEVPEWNDMDRLDDLVNAMECRTGAVEPGYRPAEHGVRFHLKGQAANPSCSGYGSKQFLGDVQFGQLMNQGSLQVCPACVQQLQYRQQGLYKH